LTRNHSFFTLHNSDLDPKWPKNSHKWCCLHVMLPPHKLAIYHVWLQYHFTNSSHYPETSFLFLVTVTFTFTIWDPKEIPSQLGLLITLLIFYIKLVWLKTSHFLTLVIVWRPTDRPITSLKLNLWGLWSLFSQYTLMCKLMWI
jgi:hypothetical protein